MTSALTKTKKEVMMKQFWEQAERYEQVSAQLEAMEEAGLTDALFAETSKQAKEIYASIDALLEQYVNGLPLRDISRCPFSGEVMQMPIDDLGLDGVWWNYYAPKRPECTLPKTFFALDGAMKLGSKIEHFPYVCHPGPDVPFVLPRLLEYIQVKAVISTIQIGAHTAYPVVYFADPPLSSVMRTNDWGTNRYWETGSVIPELSNPGEYISLTPDEEEYDFNLEPWIKAGKLLWIAPNDKQMTLHGHTSQCPYLQLSGSQKLQWIQNGQVWIENEDDTVTEINHSIMSETEFMNLIKQLEEGEQV